MFQAGALFWGFELRLYIAQRVRNLQYRFRVIYIYTYIYRERESPLNSTPPKFARPQDYSWTRKPAEQCSRYRCTLYPRSLRVRGIDRIKNHKPYYYRTIGISILVLVASLGFKVLGPQAEKAHNRQSSWMAWVPKLVVASLTGHEVPEVSFRYSASSEASTK